MALQLRRSGVEYHPLFVGLNIRNFDYKDAAVQVEQRSAAFRPFTRLLRRAGRFDFLERYDSAMALLLSKDVQPGWVVDDWIPQLAETVRHTDAAPAIDLVVHSGLVVASRGYHFQAGWIGAGLNEAFRMQQIYTRRLQPQPLATVAVSEVIFGHVACPEQWSPVKIHHKETQMTAMARVITANEVDARM